MSSNLDLLDKSSSEQGNLDANLLVDQQLNPSHSFLKTRSLGL
jgi:hypothetical protein